MKICILGAGAVGTSFAVRLAECVGTAAEDVAAVRELREVALGSSDPEARVASRPGLESSDENRHL
jgi:ketopantoate reductase